MALKLFVALLSLVLFLQACLALGGKSDKGEADFTQDVTLAANSIKGSEMIGHATTLCSPKFRGREVTSKGGRRAAQFIAKRFRELGLRPGGQAGSYYHFFKIRPGYRITSSLESFLSSLSIGEYKRGRDYMPIHLPQKRVDFDHMPCTLVGYGVSEKDLSLDEYAQVDVKGHAVVVFTGVPKQDWLKDKRNLASLSYKAQKAHERGAQCLFIVDDPAGWRPRVAMEERLRLPDPHMKIESPISIVHVKREFVADLTGMSEFALSLFAKEIRRDNRAGAKQLRGRTIHFHASLTGKAPMGRNVTAILPGRDKELAREAVVIGAHYDHLGEDEDGIYFGANDNAAGVSALLALAKAFTELKEPPKRSIVFVSFDAEEDGQRGSWRYVKRPPIALSKTVLMINFDMIGRNNPNSIIAVGTKSSKALHEIHIKMNELVGLQLEQSKSLRLGLSDHSPFYEQQVPVFYLFGGLTLDYHTVDDRPEKLDIEKMEKVARLAFLTAWAIAERRERLKFQLGL